MSVIGTEPLVAFDAAGGGGTGPRTLMGTA
jgi:hypothetical protein